MKLFMVIFNKTERLDDVLTFFAESGVTGASMIDVVGMGHVLTSDVPIFAGFKDLLSGGKPYGKLIFSIVREELVDTLTEGVTRICGGIDNPQTAIMMTLPIDNVWGLKGFPKK